MKTNFFVNCICALLFVIVTGHKKAAAQTPPIYKFDNGSLDSGSALITGAVYRYVSVYPSVDALIKVTGMSAGITLRNIDRTADGYSEAFQPEYRVNGNTNGYIDFKITFVNAGTKVPVSQPIVAVTGLDIDGGGSGSNLLKEFNTIDMGGGTSEFNSFNSEISLTQVGTAFTGSNITGLLFGALVDTTAKEVMFSVTSTNVASMTFRVGSNNQTSSNSTRYASLYFKKFTYQHYPLAISNLLNFEGAVDGNNVNLNWRFVANKYKKVELERSYEAENFNSLKVYEFITESDKKTSFQYTDNTITGAAVYYRLKATTAEGKTEYSSVLSFSLKGKKVNDLNVFPTVVQTNARVNLVANQQGSGLLQVTDFSGRVVKQETVSLQAGTNTITVNGFERFMKGNYIVTVKTGAALYAKRVIVQ